MMNVALACKTSVMPQLGTSSVIPSRFLALALIGFYKNICQPEVSETLGKLSRLDVSFCVFSHDKLTMQDQGI